VQQLAREGKPLPPGAAIDEHGRETTDPAKVAALLSFGGHKGYGLALVDELLAAYIGGSLPTLRNRWPALRDRAGEKGTCCFYFQCIRPDAISGDDFAAGRSQNENVKAVFADILGHGNQHCLLPGQPEANAARRSDEARSLIFTAAEVDALAHIAAEASVPFDRAEVRPITASV
jgi:L-2-hydroxycarboxylate dehydrogenase (NAD+)